MKTVAIIVISVVVSISATLGILIGYVAYQQYSIDIVAEPIELTTQQWEFISRLIILGIGAIIAAKMVPYFTNQYQEKQIVVDRKREDRRQQLQIQHELVQRVGKTLSLGNFILVFLNTDPYKKQEFPIDIIREHTIESMALNASIELYYSATSKIFRRWDELTELQDWALDELRIQKDDKRSEQEQKTFLEDLMKKHTQKINFEDALKKLKESGVMEVYDTFNSNYHDLLRMIEKTPPKIS